MLRNTTYIGYNLFPRYKNQAQIIPCELDKVTAQFYLDYDESTDVVNLLCQNEKGVALVDWGDGIVEQMSMPSRDHHYSISGSYIVSVYAEKCYKCMLTTNAKSTNLSTTTLPELGYGMLADVTYTSLVQNLDLSNLPFYDAYRVSLSSEQLSSNLDVVVNMGDYAFLSMLYLRACLVNALNISEQNIPFLLTLNIGGNKLGSNDIDNILGIYATIATADQSGILILSLQNPAAPPDTQGQIDKETLEELGWSIITD